jgi:hypothetical protein
MSTTRNEPRPIALAALGWGQALLSRHVFSDQAPFPTLTGLFFFKRPTEDVR